MEYPAPRAALPLHPIATGGLPRHTAEQSPHATVARRFVSLCGAKNWCSHLAAVGESASAGQRAGRAVQQRHVIELTIARRLRPGATPPGPAECRIVALAAALLALHDSLGGQGARRLRDQLDACLDGEGSLVPLFHLAHMIGLQRARGFTVEPSGLNDGAPYDLLLRRDGAEAELACETVSAEDGRDLHRTAWFNLVDGIDPDLQNWLSAHPGRYLLKMTLPNGLKDEAGADPDSLRPLSELQRRIREMLASQARSDQDASAVMRLDPLLVAGSQADELGLMTTLRRQFGPEAQLAVTRSGAGMFVIAARAGREDDIGAAMRRRLQDATPRRLTGARPGILSVFLDDTDRAEWRALRDGLQLEGETRHYLTKPDATRLVAVTVATRLELFGTGGADAAPEGEIRFRNQAHPHARSTALAPSIRSSV